MWFTKQILIADINSAENITESLVSEGLVHVRRDGVRQTPEIVHLCDLEDAAKTAGKGKWNGNATVSNLNHFHNGFNAD